MDRFALDRSKENRPRNPEPRDKRRSLHDPRRSEESEYAELIRS
jgi:hypothetical protein